MTGKILGLNNQFNIYLIIPHVRFRIKYRVQAYRKLWYSDNILQSFTVRNSLEIGQGPSTNYNCVIGKRSFDAHESRLNPFRSARMQACMLDRCT